VKQASGQRKIPKIRYGQREKITKNGDVEEKPKTAAAIATAVFG